MSIRKMRLAGACGLLLFFGLAGLLFAGIEGRLVGEVQDREGNPIEGVQVTVQAQEVDQSFDTVSNKKGKFTLVILDATKSWNIRLEKPGYLTIEEPLPLQTGGLVRQTWTLIAAGEAGAGQQMEALSGTDRGIKLYNEGVRAYNAQDPDTAVAKFEEAIAEEPKLVVAYGGLARIYLEREKWAEAQAAAEKVLELATVQLVQVDPREVEVLGQQILFDAVWAQGDKQRALTALDRMLELEAGRPAAVRVFQVAVGAIKDNDLATAETRFRQVTELEPELKESYINLAYIDRAQGEWDGVIQNTQRFLELAPEDPRGLSLLYQAHSELGQAAEADAAFVRLKTADPEMVVETFFDEGTTQFNSGDPRAAIASFRRVLETSPDHARAHYMLGLSYASAEDYSQAKVHLQRFLELAPNDPEAGSAREMLKHF